MDYRESRAYIKECEKYGSVLGLENMRELMNRLGNPQDDLRFVHVAGTNGKGSVIAYLYTVLTEAGFSVGRYISPTIYSYRERMEVNNKKISKENFAKYVSEVAGIIEIMVKEGLPHPTPFEIETAIAFLFFKDSNCNIVLLEVGMGGDLDATNIINTTVLSVLVSISMDHIGFLGSTIAEIAKKKAGIIKSNSKMISTKQREEAKESIKKRCNLCNVEFLETCPDDAVILQENINGQSFCYKNEIYELSLTGVYQKENAVLALEALNILNEIGYKTTLQQRKSGLKNAVWGGRFTVIHNNPLVIVDGAHNPAAADVLAVSIEHYLKNRKITYIMGVFKDKDYRYVIERTYKYADKIITIETPDNPRALPAKQLAKEIEKYHENVTEAKSIEWAVDEAFRITHPEDVILVFGSLSYIGQITELVKQRGEGKND